MIYETAKISERTKLKLGDNVCIGDNVFISSKELTIGDNSHINAFSSIIGRGNVYIGKNCAITYYCLLVTSTDQPSGRYMSDCCDEIERDIRTGDIVIKDGAYLGSFCCIMPGVTIGENSVIGSRAYISDDVPDDVIVYPKQELITRNRW